LFPDHVFRLQCEYIMRQKEYQFFSGFRSLKSGKRHLHIFFRQKQAFITGKKIRRSFSEKGSPL